MNDAERFWTKVNKTEGCWEWTAGLKKPELYGKFKLNKRTLLAHRVSYAMSHPLTIDLLEHREICVCHRCDNPRCVNPAHLFLGSISDNNKDKDDKGRGIACRGEKHSSSKLTENAVREIRTQYANGGITQKQLALEYGVSLSLISLIKLR
jgi:hypothetical protein